MAKGIVTNHNGKISSFGIRKLERSMLYGAKKRIALDADGMQCATASMTIEGDAILRSGMVVQGWFDDQGRQVEQNEITPVDSDGNSLEIFPSTLGVEQTLDGPVDPQDVLDLAVLSVYRLEAEDIDPGLQEELTEGHVFRLPFNYRADHKVETAFLIGNEHGFFALVGDPVPCEMVGPDTTAAEDEFDDDDDPDDLDFQMM
jgi:hypothetical protein